MSTKKSIFVRVLLFLDEDKTWIAQGLEYDIAAQGKTLKESQEVFERMLATKIVVDLKNGIEPLSQLSEAPEEYINFFNDNSSVQLAPIKDKPSISPSSPSFPPYQYYIADSRVYA